MIDLDDTYESSSTTANEIGGDRIPFTAVPYTTQEATP
jgi:hypothetical protein